VDSPPGDAQVRTELARLLRCHTATAVRFGRAFAERHGLHPTDWGALLAVAKSDHAGAPLTLGELSEYLGLSSGATTALVDRLERAGHVRRVRDESDRRRLILHHDENARPLLAAFSDPLDGLLGTLASGYTAAELDAVQRFLSDAVRQLDDYRRRFTAGG
jgi:DNA-binding MarR family transcriptional regulator